MSEKSAQNVKCQNPFHPPKMVNTENCVVVFLPSLAISFSSLTLYDYCGNVSCKMNSTHRHNWQLDVRESHRRSTGAYKN